MTAFARLATPIKPIMDNLYLDTFFFFVPTRLLWTNWKKFMGEQTDPGDSIDFTVPVTAAGNVTQGSVAEYMGCPVLSNVEINELPLRAYNLIWNEWFRDQNLQDSANVNQGDLGSGPGAYTLLRRGKRHDYFTSCLPWPQKQASAVTLPLGVEAPVLGIGVPTSSGGWSNVDADVYETGADGTGGSETTFGRSTSTILVEATSEGVGTTDNVPRIIADLTNATSASINDIREAFQIQRLLERDARGGTRYTEIVRSHFGVVSPDARLQRPEYLGGGSTPINITPIAQTGETSTTPQGNLAAMGTAAVSGHGFSKAFTEHGYIIGLANVRADLTYQKGLDKLWSRETRYDFYFPSFAHLGEQAVLNKEIYFQGSGAAANEEVFGYQERYAEMRYKPSMITGLFRSAAASSLDVWHLSEEFGSLPVLDDTFIQSDPPIDRVIAVPAEPHMLFDAWFDYKCARPMPTYGTPGLIDHF